MGKPGYIYILSNSSIADMVKIGRTSRLPDERVKELSSATGVPTPFKLEYKKKFNDCVRAEELVHKYLELNNKKVSNNREFFNVDKEEAIRVIEMVAANYFNIDKNKEGLRSYYTSWTEINNTGLECNVNRVVESVSPHNKYHEVIETRSYSDQSKEVHTFLTNDLNAFFGDVIETEDNESEDLINDLINEGENYLGGYGDGLIDIEEGLSYLHKAISMESAKACHILGEYYYEKYTESNSLKYLSKSREYLKKGSKFDGNDALYCLYLLTNDRFYDSFEPDFSAKIIDNNRLAYWGIFFKGIKKIGINNINSLIRTAIQSSINDLFTNNDYIKMANSDYKIKERFSETIREGIEVIKWCYLDIIREYNNKDDYELRGVNEKTYTIKFLEDTFDVKNFSTDINDKFIGDSIELLSIEEGNYSILGKWEGILKVNDWVSLSVYLMTPRYFKVKNVKYNKVYLEGVHPEYNSLIPMVEYNKKNFSDKNPIVIAKAGYTAPFKKDVSDVIEYCLNRGFEKAKVSPNKENESHDNDKNEVKQASKPDENTIADSKGLLNKLKSWMISK